MNKFVVLDLGWGGLIFANDLQKCKLYFKGEECENIFLHMPIFKYKMSDKEKIEVFDEYLKDINRKFNPVVIILACNTLAGLYEFTVFAKTFEGKVVNIVDIICSNVLKTYKKGDIIVVLASELTCKWNVYKKKLVQCKIEAKDIIEIGLSGVASTIERNLYSFFLAEEVLDIIKSKLMIKKINKNVIFVLGCTHYEYVKEIFNRLPSLYSIEKAVFISGREEMIKLFDMSPCTEEKEIKIYSYISKCSEETRKNLERFYHKKNMKLALKNEILLSVDD